MTSATSVPAEALKPYVEELLEHHGLPGLALAVTDRSGLRASATVGYADLAARKPVEPATLFEIGSIGKTFTAVVLLQLHEEGLLDLQAPITSYLPWFEVRSEYEPITAHHLLTHTAGIVVGADQSSDSRFDVWALRETEVGGPPGDNFHYSNVGYRVLGCLLEELTGRPYHKVVRDRVLEPLGMVGSDPAITSETRRRLAVGYDRWYDDRPSRRDGPMVPATWVETDTADGSIAASAEELAVFLRMLLNEGRSLLSPESFALMTREGNDWAYGYGLESRTVDGRHEIRHGGGMPGFGSTMLGDLDAGLGAVVFCNAPDEWELTLEVAAVALDLHRGGLSPPALPDPLAVENAKEYEGGYASAGGRLVFAAQGEGLALVCDDMEVALEPRGDDRFFVDHPDFALFLLSFRREEGAVVEACHGPDVYVREGVTHPPAHNPPGDWSTFVGHYRAYNPWLTNFRVVPRRDRLILVYPWGREDPLTHLGQGTFRVGEEDWLPERLRFDAVVDGQALRANLSGYEYYRIAAP